MKRAGAKFRVGQVVMVARGARAVAPMLIENIELSLHGSSGKEKYGNYILNFP
jgi:hypothetical protein